MVMIIVYKNDQNKCEYVIFSEFGDIWKILDDEQERD